MFYSFCSIISVRKSQINANRTLKKLSKNLNEQNFSVFSFASDGDPTYHPLIKANIMRWNSNYRPVLNFSKILFINDPLHVPKRWRYKIVSRKLSMLQKSSPNVTIDSSIIEILNLPSEVFLDSRFTKMHDDLISYTLLFLSLSNDSLSMDDRVDFIEIISYFMDFYMKMTEKVENLSPQKSNQSRIIMCFDQFFFGFIFRQCLFKSIRIKCPRTSLWANEIKSSLQAFI